MSDWQIGDLALCVDDSPLPGRKILIRRGASYRVVALAHTVVEGLPGLKLAAELGVYREDRFRKIRPDEHEDCEPEFVELLNRSKPKVPAPLSEEGVS